MAGSGIALLDLAEQIARTHHERWDGSGYPAGLSGEDMLIYLSVILTWQTFDAVTHRRPYKAAWAVEDGWWEIARKAGTDFDPGVVDAFTKVLRSTGLSLGVPS